MEMQKIECKHYLPCGVCDKFDKPCTQIGPQIVPRFQEGVTFAPYTINCDGSLDGDHLRER